MRYITKYTILFSVFILTSIICYAQRSDFVTTKGHHFLSGKNSYNYIGANYWYGGLLANTTDGKKRVKTELDFLKNKGITNLRIMAGAEGTGLINGMHRVEPALQPYPGKFNEELLSGLDFLLAEMGKRNMKAIIFLSNNWEWSGGFLQYLNWNGKLADSVMIRKLSWDEMRDHISEFYTCGSCTQQYQKQLMLIIKRKNLITKKRYIDDPAIMAWEIANEPRPMRSASVIAYKEWISKTAATIKQIDKNHLVTIGSEGELGSETMEVFESIHSNKNIDYATIHIWPKNWEWFKDTAIAKDFGNLTLNTLNYIDKHVTVLNKLNKPLVLEEFGLPRDGVSFAPGTSTKWRDEYYHIIFTKLFASMQHNGVIEGCNFWCFSGIGRPSGKQLLWEKGDDILGDPPVEEQGLNSVFDNDSSTWKVIKSFTEKINRKNKIAQTN